MRSLFYVVVTVYVVVTPYVVVMPQTSKSEIMSLILGLDSSWALFASYTFGHKVSWSMTLTYWFKITQVLFRHHNWKI